MTGSPFLSLQNEFYILHLLYHRNKNQHRASCWWKYLNMMHRHLRSILKLHGSNSPEVVRAVQDFQRRKILDKSYWEFNSIVALGQFVALGMTLVGLVARVWVILDEISPRDMVGLADGPAIASVSASKANAAAGIGKNFQGPQLQSNVEVDFGEELTVSDSSILSEPVAPAPSKRAHELDEFSGPVKKKLKPREKKKKKKKRNEMDDIFG
ncbi:ribonuclease MRP protein subunit Rmp1p [[Candida] railenensis]|uniref:Ribonuclease MRP protein subunit Rmp1p n=1 Tax=[Candida] railenensis TaxID=45579 RepID=A0A9P0VXT3_9ASCO|nr:ribonuclease MRP protein subunit Rmp1p [[Candida] railenensis]